MQDISATTYETLTDLERRHVDAYRREIVKHLYLHTADRTYVVARWCSWNNLGSDFIWNAAHSIEKYIKCILLLNGKSVRKLGHDIEKGYTQVSQLAPELLPDILVQPDDLDTQYWDNESPSTFLKRLMSHGGAGVRYDIVGNTHRRDDIYKLDAMVFVLRRLCHQLDASIGDERAGYRTQRDLLATSPSYGNHIPGSPLNKLRSRKERTSDAARAAFNNNVSFAPGDFEHEPMRDGWSQISAVLDRGLLRFLQSQTPSQQRMGVVLRNWFLKNNQIDKDLRSEIESYGPSVHQDE